MSACLTAVLVAASLRSPSPSRLRSILIEADDLRERILMAALPAQRDFVTDESHRILGYIGGFGSGKSYALARKLIWLRAAQSQSDLDGL